ncbi:ATP-dependent nuclease [Aliarcobacter lanthieri]|uniref:ATP-dependent nuclease n=1 Tax=Aliarcobacter lanthieri TaxID=1355374 RepID=UPI00047B869F|nr:AAA family ATPase [Aliarcobacter lanthieri]QKF58416.1 putative OLD family ATP-dependent endonuclease [Aliarcobacter lanthieri]
MYISKVKITNFRNFKSEEILFNDGINVIIGQNNAGKSNLIKALSLVLDGERIKRLDIDDFNKSLTFNDLKDNPPKITISVSISKGKDETPDDLPTISNWLTKLDASYESMLTYEFFLPEKKHEEYISTITSLPEGDDRTEKTWKIVKNDFLRFYTYKIWGGDLINQAQADSESLKKIDFQFLDAIRDVERDMLTGRNTLLREVFDFFMDYEIKIDETKSPETKFSEIKDRQMEFSEKADILIQELTARIASGKEEILSYAKNTGASFNKANPNFEGTFSETEMYSVLKLIVEYESGIKIPATHNGLGYNNLIFMSLLLAKMQVNADVNYLDNNAKVFTTLVIEEPEAHLHPAMQYKFLKFLNENRKEKKVRQVFVSTHSTHITSAVSLDEIICLHNENGISKIAYPKKVFSDREEKSKKYIQRFLDSTKSDMLFAQKVLFVEGIAEQLLMSIFANYLDKSLEDNHVAIINVGGRFFDHFLYLFDSTKPFTINKKIVCLTDRDPERKEKPNGKFKKCYPFEYNIDLANYEYRTNVHAGKYLEDEHPNITFFSQPIEYGKTFEYELLLANPTLKILLTDSISNKEELEDLMDLYNESGKTYQDLLSRLSTSAENQRIKDGLNCSTLNEEEKKKSIIASRYLNSVGKGENALELSYVLQENLNKKGTAEYKDFIVPSYIKEAIDKLCQ